MTARSSAWRATFVNRSETSRPDCPCRVKVAGAQQRYPVHARELKVAVAERFRNRLAVVLLEQRLGVERVQVARSTVHEEKDHASRPGDQRRVLRRERVARGRRTPVPSQDARGSQPAKAEGAALEKLAPRSCNRFVSGEQCLSSVDVHEFVQVEQHQAEFLGSGSGQHLAGPLGLGRFGRPRECQLPGSLNDKVRARFGFEPLGQRPGPSAA